MRAAEFFAGMGLMRAGLERVGITTVFANDIDKTMSPRKPLAPKGPVTSTNGPAPGGCRGIRTDRGEATLGAGV